MSKRGNRNKQTGEIAKKSIISTDKRDFLLLGGILLTALLVRLIALVDLSGTPYFSFILWDEQIYHEWAKRIAEGTFSSKSIYEFAPLFAYVMAFLYKIFAPDLVYVRVLNVVLGVATCWFVYLIGTTLANRRVGLFTCLVAALYKPLILYSIVPLKEALSTLCFAAVLYHFLVLIGALSRGKDGPFPDTPVIEKRLFITAASLGLASGLLINVRPNALIIIPLVFMLPVWHAFRDRLPVKRVGAVLSVVLLGIILALSPFMIRNYLVAGKLALTTSQGGFNLYLGNNLSNPDPYYRPVSFAKSSPFEQGIQFTIEASRRTGKTMTSEEASRYWTRETIREATNNPGAFIWKLWQKTLVMVNRFEACDHYDIDFLSNFIITFRLPFFSFWIIFPLAMVGMVHGILHDRKSRAVSLILAAYALTLIVFFTSGRYRLPMVTLLIPFAVLGLTYIVEAIRGGAFRKGGAYIALALVFLVVGNLPVRATDDKTAYYNTHAIIMSTNGLTNEAVYYWSLSSEMNKPFSAFANISLAARNFQKGDLKRGYDYLNKIGDDSFATAQKYDLIGDILLSQHNVIGAAEYYEKSLRINSAQRITLLKLIRLYRKTDPPRASHYEDRLRYVSSFYDLM
jgi:predicted membrane-bound mannosyltransferase